MTETTRFVSNTTAGLIAFAVLAAMVLLLGWANERYSMETQRDCMGALERPDPTISNYDDKMLDYTNGIKACLV